jgi:hypothetical protein
MSKQYEYHFNFGGDQIGMTASVIATSEDEAVEMLRSHLDRTSADSIFRSMHAARCNGQQCGYNPSTSRPAT